MHTLCYCRSFAILLYMLNNLKFLLEILATCYKLTGYTEEYDVL